MNSVTIKEDETTGEEQIEEGNHWIEIINDEDVPVVELKGCENQIKAGLGIALNVAESHACKSVLVFGVPGNGKSVFPYVLWRRLKEHHKVIFKLIKINCDLVPIEDPKPQKLREDLKDLFIKLDSIEEPKLVFFDEIDGIVPHAHEVNPGWRSFIYFLRACLRRNTKDTLIIGITNNPKQMNGTVKRAFFLPVYFPPTSRLIVLQMFQETLKRKEWSEIAVKYLEEMDEMGYQPQGASIRSAVDNYAIPLERDKSWWSGPINKQAMVKGLIAHSGVPLSEDDIDAYRQRNRDLITSSLRNCLPWWRDYYKDKYGK